MRTRVVMAMLMAVALSLAGLSSASASNDSAHRPMKGSTTSDYEFIGTPCGPGGIGIVALIQGGSGHMTHLGRVTFTGSDCVVFTGSVEGFATDGQGTWTAANGDELYSTFTATFKGDPGKPVPVVFEFEFDGGTGRFVHAAGHVTGNGVLVEGQTPNTGQAINTWSGWISY